MLAHIYKFIYSFIYMYVLGTNFINVVLSLTFYSAVPSITLNLGAWNQSGSGIYLEALVSREY